MMSDDCKKNARWTIRLGSALLPVSYRCGGESEARGELGLAQAEFLAHGSNIDYGYAFDAHHGDANRDVFSAGPCDRLFYAPDESSASGGVLFGWPFSGWVRHIKLSFSSIARLGSEATASSCVCQLPKDRSCDSWRRCPARTMESIRCSSSRSPARRPAFLALGFPIGSSGRRRFRALIGPLPGSRQGAPLWPYARLLSRWPWRGPGIPASRLRTSAASLPYATILRYLRIRVKRTARMRQETDRKSTR